MLLQEMPQGSSLKPWDAGYLGGRQPGLPQFHDPSKEFLCAFSLQTAKAFYSLFEDIADQLHEDDKLLFLCLRIKGVLSSRAPNAFRVPQHQHWQSTSAHRILHVAELLCDCIHRLIADTSHNGCGFLGQMRGQRVENSGAFPRARWAMDDLCTVLKEMNSIELVLIDRHYLCVHPGCKGLAGANGIGALHQLLGVQQGLLQFRRSSTIKKNISSCPIPAGKVSCEE
mmetsp:Transcript_961/g.2394  ORF Transcript_961/g.2394 Transcript_961/m.2394 type:complete len:227 (-) Transcript_961:583-1263(-)